MIAAAATTASAIKSQQRKKNSVITIEEYFQNKMAGIKETKKLNTKMNDRSTHIQHIS